MNAKSFFKLVEIQTKVASVLSFLCGVIASIGLNHQFIGLNTIVFAGALLSIDMTTTGLNNVMDFYKDRHKQGYGYTDHNAIVKYGLSLKTVWGILIVLFTIGVALGLVLVLLTDYWVLFMGIAAFGIGISYTFGPFPLSRTPFGEILSGVTMGFGIFFIAMYIQIPDPQFFKWTWLPMGRASFDFAWFDLLKWGILSAPLVVGIGNIMYANNICDYKEDLLNGRFTLPISIGLRWSKFLFVSAYVALYGLLVLIVLVGLSPMAMLLELGTAFWVIPNAIDFINNPVKKTHFKLAVQNFVILGIGLCICLGIAAVL